MTIQNFIDECINVINNTPIELSSEDDFLYESIAESIISHFEDKGIKAESWMNEEVNLLAKEKVLLSDDTEVELNIQFIFEIILNPGSKCEKTITNVSVKFKHVDIDYDVPTYKIENVKVVRESGLAGDVSEKAILLQEVNLNDTASDIARKVDIAKMEEEFDKWICMPVLHGTFFFNVSIPGTDQFINKETRDVDIKGLASYIKTNMM